MPKLTMFSAPSASGKSTMAVQMLKEDGNAVRINRDDLRKMSIPKWSGKREAWIIAAEIGMAKVAGSMKLNIIIDDTNLGALDEARWKSIAQDLGYEFKVIKLKVSLEECVRRDSLRSGSARIGRSAIERQFFRAGLVEKPIKKTVIFDIDGTLADLTHRVPWITIGANCPCSDTFGASWSSSCKVCNGTGKVQKKDHDTFYGLVTLDSPIDIVVRWIKECYKEFNVMLVSGRSPEKSELGTIEWLANLGIQYHHMLMRRANMHGPDHEEKQLILDMILRVVPKEDIAFVVDDRPSVVEMWRRNGLRVIPVRGRDDDKFYEVMNDLEATHPKSLVEGK